MSDSEKNTILNGVNDAYVVVTVSLFLFVCNNVWILKLLVPKSARISKRQQWKWRNIANSLIHSVITGCGACVCFYQSPEIRKDLISKWTFSSHCLLAVSTGYFIYDMLDMMINDPKSKTYELILHHVLVISCFTLAITTYNYEGYGLMALLVEVNSVFLHIRQLMIIQNWNRKTFVYRLNSSLNLGTFVVFRILTMGWMTRWLIQHRYDLTTFAFKLAGISLAVIMVMNIVLLLRVLKSDYRQCPKQPPTNPEILHTKAS
ncbi:TLC domain-containing protein 2-like [Macrosteles quadrilineatus]|uniref:TLC domain-containing protein 2-like n=1 Tax=Macrosteles quadrilineatus TaxID=74068 RepID=UPI0023E2C9F8|nr:TLC domain-containing protein 2-like [Macrosteles quadrilineatus]